MSRGSEVFRFNVDISRSLAVPIMAFQVERGMSSAEFFQHIVTTHPEFVEFCERHNYQFKIHVSKRRGRKPKMVISPADDTGVSHE